MFFFGGNFDNRELYFAIFHNRVKYLAAIISSKKPKMNMNAFVVTFTLATLFTLIEAKFTNELHTATVKADKFVNELHDVTVKKCGIAEFSIEVTLLTSDVIWKKENEFLKQTERLIMKRKGLKHTLSIFNSTSKDSGAYTCILVQNNGANTLVLDRKTASLDIEESSKPFLKTSTLVKVAAAGAAAVGVAAGTLPLVGFTAAGVTAGSLAAVAQSYIGCVSAGSVFAALQSAGAAGMAATTKAIIATGGAAVTALTDNGSNEC